MATKSYGCAHLWSGYAAARCAEAFRVSVDWRLDAQAGPPRLIVSR